MASLNGFTRLMQEDDLGYAEWSLRGAQRQVEHLRAKARQDAQERFVAWIEEWVALVAVDPDEPVRGWADWLASRLSAVVDEARYTHASCPEELEDRLDTPRLEARA